MYRTKTLPIAKAHVVAQLDIAWRAITMVDLRVLCVYI
jgi:hypothetical protein